MGKQLANSIYFFIAFAAIVSGCKRLDVEEAAAGEVTFSVNATLDNQPFNFEAGTSDSYMDASYRRNKYGVYEFCGGYKFANSSVQSLSLCWQHNARSFPGESIDPWEVIVAGEHQLVNKDYELDERKLQFFAPYAYYKSYAWTINGQEFSDPFLAVDFEDDEPVEVGLMVQNTINGNSDSGFHSVSIFNSEVLDYFYRPMSYVSSAESGVVEFYYPYEAYDEVQRPTDQISWEVLDEDGITYYEGARITHVFKDKGPYTVKMQFGNYQGTTYQFFDTKRVLGKRAPAEVLANFDYDLFPSQGFDTGKLILSYRDGQGALYKSYTPSGGSQQSLMIANAEDYGEDQDGDKTIKVAVSGAVILYNVHDPEDTKILNLENGVFALGYPEF